MPTKSADTVLGYGQLTVARSDVEEIETSSLDRIERPWDPSRIRDVRCPSPRRGPDLPIRAERRGEWTRTRRCAHISVSLEL